jgi:hypothetical protein
MSAQDQIPEFPESKLKENYAVFCAYAEKIAEIARQKYPHMSPTVDLVVALNVVQSAYDDIKRYKMYHLEDFQKNKSDAAKRAAYFTKWILKLRPIMVNHDRSYLAAAEKTKDRSLFLNEFLAISWGLDNLAAEQGIQGIRLRRRALANILYDFHFREINGDGLIALFLLLSDLAKDRTSILETSVN